MFKNKRPARGSGGGADEGAGDGEAAAAAAATAAAEKARMWEEEGAKTLEQLEPLVSNNVTAPKHVQEVLQVLVLHAGAHPPTSATSARAAALLDRLVVAHPPAVQQGDTLLVNNNLWDPVTCKWQHDLHARLPRLEPLTRAVGLAALAGSARNALAEAAGLAGRLPLAQDAPRSGDLGEVLLFRHWVRLLKADLDVRLGALRGSPDPSAWRGQLENSLLVRIMQTITTWNDGSRSKPALIRTLAETAVLGALAEQQQGRYEGQPEPATAAAGGTSTSGRGAAAAAGGGAGGGGGGTWGSRWLLCPPGEVGSLAASVLGMLYDAYGALDELHSFVRRGSVGRDNDLVRTDMALHNAVTKGLIYREAGNLAILLQSLPPIATVRLLVYTVADLAYRRSDGGEGLGEGLRAVAEHYIDFGVGEPPKFRASDALRFLLDEPEDGADGAAASGRGHHHSGHAGSTWTWAAGAVLPFLPDRAGLPLLVSTLAAAALRAAAAEQRRLQRLVAGGGGGGDEGMEVEEGLSVADKLAELKTEAAAVAALYGKAAERLARDCAGGGAGRGGGGGAGDPTAAVAVAQRCANLLAGRWLGAAQAVGVRG
ncbi:hypothetical protein GPECTOR_6g695 [Gonium pectorale]|uniref:Uncharacterized protein n=1 Tax=Gonium pectorale TaxID=33097 RepID=A0A150GV70_GONPE|nr:hypothetical protein GPECTOR_6g695 [Gonium pectorale]|eukprot:KXZ53777.1 hypothetical protein GPECTOR_6g695 [Gonium pectorale]